MGDEGNWIKVTTPVRKQCCRKKVTPSPSSTTTDAATNKLDNNNKHLPSVLTGENTHACEEAVEAVEEKRHGQTQNTEEEEVMKTDSIEKNDFLKTEFSTLHHEQVQCTITSHGDVKGVDTACAVLP